MSTIVDANKIMEDRRPNIVVIITDQERSHKHWPKGWAEQNLRCHYDRVIGCKNDNDRSSAVFPNAFTATTECSPSRASLLTSSYPTEHGVVTTPGVLNPISDRGISSNNEDAQMNTSERSPRPNLLRLLSAQHTKSTEAKGYNVSWKGKWHLFHSNDPTILNYYGATSPWNPPDAGHSLCSSYTLGGGKKYNHDGRFLRGTKRKFDVLLKQQKSADDGLDCSPESDESTEEEEETESVFDFLSKQKLDTDGNRTQPFCLIASLVNPHDVWASSCYSKLSDDEFYCETGYHPRDFESIPIALPPSHKDDLLSKPSIQSLMSSHPVFGDLSDSNDDDDQQRKSDALRYVRFYAYLHKLVDDEIDSLLDELKATGQMDNTIIIRMADHGELGLSHAMREKRMQSYEETMGIPLVINYPSKWFNHGDADYSTSTARVIPNLVSSIDILPTIADLAGIDCSQYQYRGTSLVPFLRNESKTCKNKEEILFTFDEPLAPRGIPGYIRCIRTHDIKYSVYFTSDGKRIEYEMYSLQEDPHEMLNLCGPNTAPDEKWYSWHEKLTQLMKKKGAVPVDFDWEYMTKPKQWTHFVDLSKSDLIK